MIMKLMNFQILPISNIPENPDVKIKKFTR